LNKKNLNGTDDSFFVTPQNDKLVKSYYGGIIEVLQNQQYHFENDIIHDLIKKHSISNSIEFEIKLIKKILNNKLEFINKLGNKILLYRKEEDNGVVFNYLVDADNYFFHLKFITNKNNVILYFTVFGNNDFDTEKFKLKVYEVFKDYLLSLDLSMINILYYLIDKTGCPSNIGITEKVETEIKKENYPFIKDIDKLIEDYSNSKSSILFLVGSPGTGKTRFIRYLLSKMYDQEEDGYIYYTSDKTVIEHGGIFTNFLQNNADIMVLEDFDFHLNSRKEGNTVMYHLLGLSDGLIQSFNKKIIISTNLSNLQNIDEAVKRKGRCFDILDFRLLQWDEVVYFFKCNNYEKIISKIEEKEYSLADLYYILNNKGDKKIEVRSIGVGFK
jgi:hypothetical protein